MRRSRPRRIFAAMARRRQHGRPYRLAGLVLALALRVGMSPLVASFAVGRCQQLVYLLRTLMAAGRLPEVPVWIDSPMAVEATDVFRRHAEEHDFAEAKMAARKAQIGVAQAQAEATATAAAVGLGIRDGCLACPAVRSPPGKRRSDRAARGLSRPERRVAVSARGSAGR